MANIIILDIDDTLNHLSHALAEGFEKEKVVVPPISDWSTTSIHEIVAWSPGEFVRFMDKHQSILHAKPVDGLREFLASLRAAGYAPECLTARGMLSNARALTESWMQDCLGEILPYQILPYTDSKADFIRSRADEIALVFEDNLRHLNDYARLLGPEKVVCVDQPWNRDGLVAGVCRVRSVMDYRFTPFDGHTSKETYSARVELVFG